MLEMNLNPDTRKKTIPETLEGKRNYLSAKIKELKWRENLIEVKLRTHSIHDHEASDPLIAQVSEKLHEIEELEKELEEVETKINAKSWKTRSAETVQRKIDSAKRSIGSIKGKLPLRKTSNKRATPAPIVKSESTPTTTEPEIVPVVEKNTETMGADHAKALITNENIDQKEKERLLGLQKQKKALLEKKMAKEKPFQSEDIATDSIPNETLLKDNEAILDPMMEIEAYFQRLDPQYLQQLESLNTKMGEPINKEVRLVVCIPVAGHQESNNIYQTLESYSKQKRSLKEFEILLFVNSPEEVQTEEEIKKTMAEIERARKEFPELQIRVAQAFLPKEKVRMGNIRKIGTDLALLRQKLAGIKRDLILLSNDADNRGVSEGYVDAYIKYFEENPEKEGAVGNLQFDPNVFIRFPVIHLQQEFSTFLDQVGFKNGNVTLFGSNSCMKSSIYAAIGGYPPGLKTGEQDWSGKTIRKLRKKKSTLGFVEDGTLVTSSRRSVASTVLKMETEITSGDTENETKIRILDLSSFQIFDYANKEALKNLRQELEKTINELIETYEKGEKLGKNAFYYRTNLEKVGIKYIVDSTGIIHIVNMDRFIARQEVMQGIIKRGEKNMAKVIEESWKV